MRLRGELSTVIDGEPVDVGAIVCVSKHRRLAIAGGLNDRRVCMLVRALLMAARDTCCERTSALCEP